MFLINALHHTWELPLGQLEGLEETPGVQTIGVIHPIDVHSATGARGEEGLVKRW